MSDITIRDARKPGFYRIDNDILSAGFGSILKPNGIAIYNAIVYHVDFTSQKTKISYGRLGQDVGLSRRQAIREVEKLERLNFIHIERSPHKANKMTLLDKSCWIMPEKIEQTHRSDKGKPRKKQKVTESHQQGVTESHQQGVTESHQQGVTESHPIVTESHPTSDSQSPKQKDHYKNLNKNQQQQEEIAVVAAEINTILSKGKRKEQLTPKQIELICTIHELTSPQEIIKAINYYASKNFKLKRGTEHIGSIPAILIGKKNSNGHESHCFLGGECIFPDPESQQEHENQHTPEPEPVPYIDWQAKLDALPDEDRDRLRSQAEKKLGSHFAQMHDWAKKDTVRLVMLQLLQKEAMP